jgi:hypothetical protein
MTLEEANAILRTYGKVKPVVHVKKKPAKAKLVSLVRPARKAKPGQKLVTIVSKPFSI